MTLNQILFQIPLREKVLLGTSLLFDIVHIVDRSTITFTLGVIVSTLAIINYTLQIRKNLKKEVKP